MATGLLHREQRRRRRAWVVVGTCLPHFWWWCCPARGLRSVNRGSRLRWLAAAQRSSSVNVAFKNCCPSSILVRHEGTAQPALSSEQSRRTGGALRAGRACNSACNSAWVGWTDPATHPLPLVRLLFCLQPVLQQASSVRHPRYAQYKYFQARLQSAAQPGENHAADQGRLVALPRAADLCA